MKFRIGGEITGCMTAILKNIEYGLDLILCLTWGDNLAIKFISLKNSLMRWSEGINLNLINTFQTKNK